MARKANYINNPNNFGFIMTVSEWLERVNSHFFMDSDGWGYPMKDDMVDYTISILPSNIKKVPKDSTHILWYSKNKNLVF